MSSTYLSWPGLFLWRFTQNGGIKFSLSETLANAQTLVNKIIKNVNDFFFLEATTGIFVKRWKKKHFNLCYGELFEKSVFKTRYHVSKNSQD